MKPPLHLLTLPRYDEHVRDRPVRRPVDGSRMQAWPRKLATAVPASLRVFRRAMSTPLGAIQPGTRVVSSRGRSLGVVRSVVVEVDSGFSAYAISPDALDARVILLPRQAVRERDDVGVVDDRLAQLLLRRSA